MEYGSDYQPQCGGLSSPKGALVGFKNHYPNISKPSKNPVKTCKNHSKPKQNTKNLHKNTKNNIRLRPQQRLRRLVGNVGRLRQVVMGRCLTHHMDHPLQATAPVGPNRKQKTCFWSCCCFLGVFLKAFLIWAFWKCFFRKF